MFGKRQEKVEYKKLPEQADLEVPVEEPETVGMQGFTEDKKPAESKPVSVPTQEPTSAPVKAPVPVPAPVEKPVERYQIIETGLAAQEGVYVYKIVTNKYLGELGGVYET